MDLLCYILPLFLLSVAQGKLINKTRTTVARTPGPAIGNQECAKRLRTLTTEAHATVEPDNSTVYGNFRFSQTDGVGEVTIVGVVGGLNPGDHGLHIHELGNIGASCEDAGEHFNPDNFSHSGINNAKRHAGDLGNINANDVGIAFVNVKSSAFTLNGDYTVIGRTVVVHEKRDDLGLGKESDSKTTGHAGGRLACGIIAIVEEVQNIDPATLANRYPYKKERETKPNRSKLVKQKNSGNMVSLSAVLSVTSLTVYLLTSSGFSP